MPLRDHFHPPLSDQRPWAAFHNLWLVSILRRLNAVLPQQYFGLPQARLSSAVEPDVVFETETGLPSDSWAPRPVRMVSASFAAPDVFEVRVYNEKHYTRLVAAVELVSPANKDRPTHRRAFAAKCASYLQQQISVVIIDLVTERQANLYTELLDLLDVTAAAPERDWLLYAIACRTTKSKEQWRMETWPSELAVGAPLPTVPLWLADNLAVPLELEAPYEETWQLLRLP